ncbi:MAG TPA: C39 family peptidase, partial [Candidatus Sulfotelmatobacter sp.]|nr:C39 family peptidase [Candidatus Sulfotelmatobacter sp.]
VMFWTPGARSVVDSWQAETDRIWTRDLSRYRADALLQEESLHRAIGSEPLAQRKARLDELAIATTPADFVILRSNWSLEARLVPIDRVIAAGVASLADQSQQAKTLGIRSDPAGDLLTRANSYTRMDSQDRMARAELLIRNLGSVRLDLQGRVVAAGIAQQAFSHAGNEIAVAAIYGIDLSAYQVRIDIDHAAYSNATSAAAFTNITGDLNAVAAAADGAINTVLSQTHVISGVTFYYQSHPLSCEETATSMALTHQGIYLSQDQILAEAGADLRPMYVDGAGRVRWGDPYVSFVGNVNGSEHNYTGYQMNYPPLVRIAEAHGARVIAYGSMSAATIYARVIAGHPVVAYATWDWAWHPRHDYLAFDGRWVPWIGPYADAHVYTVVGVSPTQVLVNDPIRGQYWVSKGAFQAAYSDFGEAIVFA